MTSAAAIIATGLFDAAYYVETYPDIAAAGIAPDEHYARFGQSERRMPNAYFEAAAYEAKIGDTGSIIPLLHYARIGEAADVPPGPNFDPAWYRHAYGLPRGVSALADFLRNRCSLRRLPALKFYLPFHSKSESMLLAKRDCFASIIAEMASGLPMLTEAEAIARSGVFDANHYLINGSDVHEASLDPVEHFCVFGWQEGRWPNIYFNTAWYIRTNPDVGRLGINPLLHYVLQGEKKGRRPIIYFDPIWYRKRYNIAEDVISLGHFLANRRSQRYSSNGHFDLEWYLMRYASHVGANRDPFAHFLQVATYEDVQPAPDFDAAVVRRRNVGRRSRNFVWTLHPDRDNPLIRLMYKSYT